MFSDSWQSLKIYFILTYNNFSLFVLHFLPHSPSNDNISSLLPHLAFIQIVNGLPFPMSNGRVGSCSTLALCWLIKMPEWSRLVKTESLFSHKNVCSHSVKKFRIRKKGKRDRKRPSRFGVTSPNFKSGLLLDHIFISTFCLACFFFLLKLVHKENKKILQEVCKTVMTR